MSIQRLKYNVQDKLNLRPSEESSSSYTIQDESVHYKKKYVCRYFGSLIPAVLLMLIEFCIFRFDNQNGYICGPVDWFIFYWITSSKVQNFPHLSSAREIHRHHCRPPALPDRRSAVAQPPSCSSISKTINHSKPHVDPLFYLRSVELYMQGYILLLCQICQDFFLVSKWNQSALWMNDYNCSLLRKIFWRKLSCLLNWFFLFDQLS